MKPSRYDIELTCRKLRTSARIWAAKGGRHPAQSFLRCAEYLEQLVKKQPKEKPCQTRSST